MAAAHLDQCSLSACDPAAMTDTEAVQDVGTKLNRNAERHCQVDKGHCSHNSSSSRAVAAFMGRHSSPA